MDGDTSTSSQKRKRDNYDDSSDDEPATYGKQILPVACLPHDYDGEPQDGLEYLFTVRRDAQRLPEITRVLNPFESKPFPEIIKQGGPSHPSLPSDQWCQTLEMRFRNLRKNFNQPTIFVGRTHEAGRKYMPDHKERDLWWAYLEGRPESEWNISKKASKRQAKRQQHQQRNNQQGMHSWGGRPQQPVQSTIIPESSLLYDEGEVEKALSIDPAEGLPTPTGTPGPPIHADTASSSHDIGASASLTPREPSTQVLKLISEPTALHLLMYFTHWMNCHMEAPDSSPFTPRESHARWIFALLARVGDHVNADDMNLLRNLARACIALLDTLIERRISPRVVIAEDNLMTERSCWIILSIIVHVWKQKDLWTDVENVLGKYPAPSS